MSVLEKVNCSNDIKKLNENELPELCSELRQIIVKTVSENGGHLSSNLGAVELTVALHRVYDSQIDRIVFDVGHQSYAHKIITGRRDFFSSLRKEGGISGFPKPYEANDDAFTAGHASESISVALGMARARSRLDGNYSVVAVIGDGALTGGLAYEGLSDAAQSGEPIVIILNDNNMSISRNVGGVSNILQNLRTKQSYIDFKRVYRAVFSHFPKAYNFNHSIKEWVKKQVLPDNIFSELGLTYLGPVDGHNLNELERSIRHARDIKVPVILHVTTKKGKGYSFAEQRPDVFHGVGKFNSETGEVIQGETTFSDIFGDEICKLAVKNKNIVALTAAMTSGTGLSHFSDCFKDRFFDVGISEGHAASMCGGMAKQGLVPVFAVYSSFLQRSFDMIIEDICLQKLHVVLAIDRAGIVGADGETHNGLFDISYLRTAPYMKIYCPASFSELRDMLDIAVLKDNGPVALRYSRGSEKKYTASFTDKETYLNHGNDLTLVTYGITVNSVQSAVREVTQCGINTDLLKIGYITEEDYPEIISSVSRTGKLLVVEDCCSRGSFGEYISSLILRNGLNLKIAEFVNFGSGFVEHGCPDYVYNKYGLSADRLTEKIKEICRAE